MTRLGFEPKTHSLEGCCSTQLSYQAIVLRVQKYKKSPNRKGWDSVVIVTITRTYFTWSTMALKASGLFKARSARTLRLISIPDLVSLSMNWL